MEVARSTSHLEVAACPAEALGRLDPLIDGHRHLLVSGFGRYLADLSAPVTRQAFAAAAASSDAVVLEVADGGDPVAATTVAPAPWETEHLGVRVGKVGELVGVDEPAMRTAAAQRLLEAAGAHWADTGGGLLVARIDIDDTDALVGAQRAGFEILETSATYINDNDVPYRSVHRSKGYDVVPYLHGAGDAVPESARQLIRRWVDDTDRTGHLYRDRALDPERVRALYLAWLDNTFSGAYGDVVYAAWRGDQVVGFVSWTEDPELDALAGAKILRAGIGAAVSPEGQGALGDIYAAICSQRPLGSRLVEHTTQAGNEAVLTVWARFATLRPSSCHYVLHGWFGR